MNLRVPLIGILLFTLLASILSGCGGGGGGSSPTGNLEGYVYVPADIRAVRQGTYMSLTRSDTVPEGYVPLAQAQIEAAINGKFFRVVTDASGHFLINGIPVGKVTVKIIPPPDSAHQELTTTVDIVANSKSLVGQGGNISLLSADANSLSVVINRIDTSQWPVAKIYVSVIDPYANAPIVGMRPDNFTIAINGSTGEIPTRVDQVSAVDVPISTALVLDRSGSMTGYNYDDEPLNKMKEAANAFVDLLSPADECEIISLGDDVQTNQSFTNNKALLSDAINSLNSYGGTPLFDAIWQGITDASSRSNSRKAVIAMTDGGENASSYDHGGGGNVDILISYAQQKGIPVYTIGLQGYGFTRSIKSGSSTENTVLKGDVGRWDTHAVRSTRSAESDLQRIANNTGGEYFYAPNASDLKPIYDRIAIRAKQQYILTVTATDPSSDGCDVNVGVTCSGKEGNGSGTAGTPKLINPLESGYSLSAGFGDGIDNPNDYVTGYVHAGQDFMAAQDTPVLAIADGIVEDSSMTLGFYGSVEGGVGGAILVKHTIDSKIFYAVYGHIRPINGGSTLPGRGTSVSKGVPFVEIGLYTDGGRDKSHLHFGIHPTTPDADKPFRGRVPRDNSNPSGTDMLGWIDPMPVLKNGAATW